MAGQSVTTLAVAEMRRKLRIGGLAVFEMKIPGEPRKHLFSLCLIGGLQCRAT